MIQPLKGRPLNAYEKGLFDTFAFLHLAIAAVFLPLAFLQSWVIIHTQGPYWTDFTAYYAAAYMVHHAPADLYQPSAYVEFYHTLKATALPFNHALTYWASPVFALFLAPLAELPYDKAFLAWSVINLLLCWLLARQIGRLCQTAGHQDLTPFFQSCAFGLMVTFYIIMRGQFTLLTCLCFVNFLLSIKRQKNLSAGFWLAMLLQIRPPLFIPFLFYILGCRQWKILLTVLLLSLLFIFISMVILGSHVWQHYVQLLHYFSVLTDDTVRHVHDMSNLLGLLSNVVSNDKSWLTISAANGFYAFMCVFFFFWPWLRATMELKLTSVALLAPFAFFFSPYLHVYDTLLLLPASVIITHCLRQCGQARWMILCYILGSYIAALNYQWNCRMLLLIMCGLSFYLMTGGGNWQEEDLHASHAK